MLGGGCVWGVLTENLNPNSDWHKQMESSSNYKLDWFSRLGQDPVGRNEFYSPQACLLTILHFLSPAPQPHSTSFFLFGKDGVFLCPEMRKGSCQREVRVRPKLAGDNFAGGGIISENFPMQRFTPWRHLDVHGLLFKVKDPAPRRRGRLVGVVWAAGRFFYKKCSSEIELQKELCFKMISYGWMKNQLLQRRI